MANEGVIFEVPSRPSGSPTLRKLQDVLRSPGGCPELPIFGFSRNTSEKYQKSASLEYLIPVFLLGYADPVNAVLLPREMKLLK